MKNKFIIFIVGIIAVSVLIYFGIYLTGWAVVEGDSYVLRNISVENVLAGENITVVLTAFVNSEDELYGIEEVVPEGLVVVDPGQGSMAEQGKIKWLVIDNVVEGEYVHYYVLSSEDVIGEVNFSGEFLFETQSETQETLGEENAFIFRQDDCTFQDDGTVCGSAFCSYDFCSGAGNNNYIDYPEHVDRVCQGGECVDTQCVFTTTICGQTKVCSTVEPPCDVCGTGMANCNLNTTDSCEVNLLDDSNNCGSCGSSCGNGLACVNGICENEICAEPDVLNYDTMDEIAASVISYYLGNISLNEIVRRARIYKNCGN